MFLEPLARILYILFLWQGSWSKSEPPDFNKLFKWATTQQPEAKEQTPEQMMSLLKAFASVHNPKQNRNSDNG